MAGQASVSWFMAALSICAFFFLTLFYAQIEFGRACFAFCCWSSSRSRFAAVAWAAPFLLVRHTHELLLTNMLTVAAMAVVATAVAATAAVAAMAVAATVAASAAVTVVTECPSSARA